MEVIITKYGSGIYATDTYGQATQTTFKFTTGDLLELQWNGPLKTFTTIKESTGKKYSSN